MEFLVNFTLNLSGRLETAKQEIARHYACAGAELARSLTGEGLFLCQRIFSLVDDN